MLLVVDFLNVAYRSFHAIRALSTSAGQPTNAVYGFIQSVHHWLAEVKATHAAIVFDAETPRRRLDILPSYKANRPPAPETLISQLGILTDLFPLLGWPTAFDPLHEADDLGAAIAVAAARGGETVRIASNDKDFLQIIGPRIHLLRSTPKEKIEVDEAWLEQRWGVRPSQVADFFALVGDSSDNIPGAPGVGEKTAAELIRQFGSVENLLSHLDDVKRPRVREALRSSVEIIRRNVRLITLCPVPGTPPIENFRLQPPRYEPLLAALSKMEFKSLHARYEKESRETSSGRQGLLF